MSLAPFTPQYLDSSELAQYGIPLVAQQPDIMNLVRMASSILDEECGRIDGDGNGSLVYTTYIQRILLQTRNRNLIYLPMKPISPVDTATVTALQGLATSGLNTTFTGVQANTIISGFTGQLSGLIAASGRYTYGRQDMSTGYPYAYQFINPLSLITLFGGPAPFIPLDVTQADYSAATGEVWIPAGLQLQQYSEVLIIYNSGFDPRFMPPVLKHVCASLVKNALAKGNATTAMTSLTLGRAGATATFQPQLIDPTLDRMLTPYRMVRGI
jgi:hypothetical protein